MSRTAPLSARYRVGALLGPLFLSSSVALVLSACGGPGGTVPPPRAQVGASGGTYDDGRDGRSPETAWHACMDTRSDYRRVAEYRCLDGSMPLGGSIPAGGAARSGNIGAGPDGHVLDRYVVPCPEGEIVLFVDMYHCEEENGPLSEAEIHAAYQDLQRYAVAPEDSSPAVVTRARRAAQQLGFDIPGCDALFDFFMPPERELPDWRHLAKIYSAFALIELYPDRAEFAAGMTNERRADLEQHASTQGVLGLVDTYRRYIQAGYTNFQHPTLERLAAISREQLLAEMGVHTATCHAETVAGTP